MGLNTGKQGRAGNAIIQSRRGIFFTLIAISLLGIILFSYSITYSYSLQEKSAILETRVDTMNRFIHSVDSDMENAIYISGYRSIVALTDYVVTNGTYVADTQSALESLFLNGTVEGHDSVFMQNNTFADWALKIAGKGAEVGINVSIGVESVTIEHVSPWEVRFSVSSGLNISDQKSAANWTREQELYSDISLIGFEDPWYAMHTSGMVVKRINTSMFDGNFTPENDTTNLRQHIANTYYISFNASPSFLMRFEDNHNASEFGIESLVNKTEILNYCSITTSSVDTICWQQDTAINTWSVNGMNDTNFKIDNETNSDDLARLQRYEVENLIYGGS